MVLATIHATRGWLTMPQPLSPGLATDRLRIGNLPTQSDIKNRHADGSIKFAVLTAHVPADGDYPLTAYSPPADVAPFPDTPQPAFWLALKIVSTWYSAGHWPQNVTSRWLDGPLCREYRSYVPWVTNNQMPHPFLRAVINAREHRDGTWLFDCCIENCLRSVGGPVTYSIYAGVDSTVLWSKVGVLHRYRARWRMAWWLKSPMTPGLSAKPDFAALTMPAGELTEEVVRAQRRAPPDPLDPPSAVTPDLTLHVAAKAIPNYSPNVANWIDWVWGPDFEILGKGGLDPYMPGHGGRDEIAPYPNWAARYLVHRDPNQLEYVLAHGRLAGSWPIHTREDDGSFVTADARPNFWDSEFWQSAGLDGPRGDGSDNPLTPDVDHQPSLAYIPYLLTGSQHDCDEMVFWANYCILNGHPETNYSGGGSERLMYGQQPRGFAWGLRNVVDAAAWVPDDHPLKEYLTRAAQRNLDWCDWVAADPLGYNQWPAYGTFWIAQNTPPEWVMDNQLWVKSWQYSYIMWAIHHAHEQGFTGGEAWLASQVAFWVGWTNDPDYQDGAATYGHPVGRSPAGPWYTENWQAFGLGLGEAQDWAGYYGMEIALLCVIGQQIGVPGSDTAYAFAMSKPRMTEHAGGRAGFHMVA